MYNAEAQTIISGQISGEEGTPLENVSITYGKTGTTLISGFTRSDTKGNFKLAIPAEGDSILLHFSLLGYEQKTIAVKNKTWNHTITLSQKTEQIKEVVVTAPPVFRRNDTLNYDVGAFTSKQDRVIGDIIKKLPGIEIEDGEILYNGKPIQKYYINGLDLLEGKYGLANNNLPANAVQRVQIIENNQPIKILDSVLFSNRASLNIKLKKLTTTGSARAGAGFSPYLRDVAITPMTFAKTFQTINSFQSNNIGNNSRNQLKNFSTPDMLDADQVTNSESNPLSLSIRDVSSPPFPEKRWLDNNINLFNSNILQKMANDIELKGSITYVRNKNKRYGRNDVSMLTPAQHISFSEEIDNSYYSSYWGGNVTILKNKKNIYLKDILSADFEQTANTGNILRDQLSSVYQQKGLKTVNISNRSSTAKLFGRQLITFSSLINYSRAPQTLTIAPNPFTILSLPSNTIEQQVGYTNIETDNYVSFIKQYKDLSIQLKSGGSYQKQVLDTHIEPAQDVYSTIKDANHVSLTILQAYLNARIQYKHKKLTIDVNTPVYLRNFEVSNETGDNTDNRVITEPRFSILYPLNPSLKIITTGGYRKYFSDIGALYTAMVINSYQEIKKYNGAINESDNYNASLGLEYTNPSSAVFGNLTYTNTTQYKDYIPKNQIEANGLNTVDIVHLPNQTVSNTLNGSLSKYFSGIKTLVTFGIGGISTSSYYLFDDILQQLRTRGYSSAIHFDNTFFDKFSFNYTSKISVFKNLLFRQTSSSTIFINQHSMEMNFFPLNNQTFTFNSEYYASNQKKNSKQLFIDARYRFSITKPKLDFEINGLNVLNTTTYNQLYSSGYAITQSSFNLRKRQLLLTARFGF
jgi:hypothetical protein